MTNKTLAEWVLTHKDGPIYAVSINGVKWPHYNRCKGLCPLCNDKNLLRKKLTDEEITQAVRSGKLNGWNEPFKFALMNNTLYHLACIKKKYGTIPEDCVHE